MKPPEMVISPTTMENHENTLHESENEIIGITSSFIRKSHLYVSYGWILLVALWLPI